MLLERGSTCLVAALALGCATTSGGSESTAEAVNIDLSVDALQDVNPTSETFDQPVHPNDYQGMVSAWYFGHST